MRQAGKPAAPKTTKPKPKATKPKPKPAAKNKGTSATRAHGPHQGKKVQTVFADAASEEGRNINTVLRVGYQLNAPELALLSMLCLGFGENSWTTVGCNSSNHCGVFQLDSDWQKMHAYTDVAYWASYAYQHGFYGGFGGIIHIARTHPDFAPGRIANMCQGAYANLDEGQAYYEKFIGDAHSALATYGPDAKRGIKYKGGGGIPGVYSNSTQGQSLLAKIKAINWAGYEVNIIKYIRGGANEAAHKAEVYATTLDKVTVVKPTK